MEISLIILVLLLGFVYGLFRWIINKGRDFKELVKPRLEKHNLEFISSEYPGLFNVGPFPKFELEIGKPQINNGAIRYEKTFYRKITAKKPDNTQQEIWAKIETGWFKDTTIQFIPELNELE